MQLQRGSSTPAIQESAELADIRRTSPRIKLLPMHNSIRKILGAGALLLILVSALDPAFAGNKFETISGGVSGSVKLKKEHIQIVLYVVSGIFLFSTLLAIALPHHNALLLNFANWKQSATVLFIFCILCGVSGYLIV